METKNDTVLRQLEEEFGIPRSLMIDPSIAGRYCPLVIPTEPNLKDYQPFEDQRDDTAIEQLDWSFRQYRDRGDYGCVYAVSHPLWGAVAVKVGRVTPYETGLQHKLATDIGIALPIYGYLNLAATMPSHLPDWIQQYECDEPDELGLLMMPLLDEVEQWYGEAIQYQVWKAYQSFFWHHINERTTHRWDSHFGNMAIYQRRIMALDFSDRG